MSEDELIKIVARAICVQKGSDPDEVKACGYAYPPPWDAIVDEARAAVLATLKAIREPTQAIKDELAIFGGDHGDLAWDAAIDVLLKEIGDG